MNLSNFVQQVSGETVIRARAGWSRVWSSSSFSSWDISGLRALSFMTAFPKIFSSICTSVTWILSYTVLNVLQLGRAVAPVQWEAWTPLAVLWLPRAHGQSSGSQHKPGPQKGVLSGGMKDFRQLWEQPSQYLACLNKIFLRPIISRWWSYLLHNFDGWFSVGKRSKSQPHEV